MEPLMPTVTGRSRPWTDHRLAVEGMAWKYRTGAPWRDVPERFGKWNSIYKPQRRRALLQPAQAVAWDRDALRQAPPQLPRRRQPCRRPDLDQIRLDQHDLARIDPYPRKRGLVRTGAHSLTGAANGALLGTVVGRYGPIVGVVFGRLHSPGHPLRLLR